MIPVQHIHPLVVHFPIVLVTLLAAADTFGLFRGAALTNRSCFGNASTILAVAAAVSAVLAFTFGDMALEFAEAKGFHSPVAEIHEGLGEAVAIILVIWGAIRAFLWARDIETRGFIRTLVPVMEICAVAIVVVTAYYGGQLVYDLGVNVS